MGCFILDYLQIQNNAGQAMYQFLKKPQDKKRYQSYFHNAIASYGAENFSHEILCESEVISEIKELEIFWIDKLKSTDRDIGYNITKGGDGSLGHIVTEEARQKISKAHSGKYDGELNPFYGKKHSDETKEKLKNINLGKGAGEKNNFYGKKHNDNSLLKMIKFNTQEKIDELESLKQQGYTYTALSKMFNCGKDTLTRVFKRRGGYSKFK